MATKKSHWTHRVVQLEEDLDESRNSILSLQIQYKGLSAHLTIALRNQWLKRNQFDNSKMNVMHPGFKLRNFGHVCSNMQTPGTNRRLLHHQSTHVQLNLNKPTPGNE
jgi:hypothetical protein